MRRAPAALALALLLAGCGAAAPAAPSFTYARLGGVLRGLRPGEARALAVACGGSPRALRTRRVGESLLLRFRWRPEETCTLRWGPGPGTQRIGDSLGPGPARRLTARAPLLADPVPVVTLDLDAFIPRRPDRGLPGDPTFLRFSPSGRLLALGGARGRVRVIGVADGRTVLDARVAEGRAKSAAFSPDEAVFFLGEQSREGWIRAIELRTGRELWRHRLAADLGTSAAWDPGSELAWVEYPGPYRMRATPDGDLLVAALHNWYPEGRPPLRQLSRLYRFEGRTGALRWRWPAAAPAPRALTWFDADAGVRTAVGVLGSARPWRAGAETPPGLYAVDLATGRERWRYPFRPLPPFRSVNTWRSVAVRPDGRRAAASTGDGRLYILEEGRPRWIEARGGPVLLSGFPIVAETGSLGATREFAIFALGGGYIPIQAAPQGASTSQPHPNANAVLFFDWAGRLRWRWPTPNRPNGLALSRDGRWLAIALSKSRAFRRGDVNGMVLFDTRAPDGRHHAGEFRTAGPVPYDQIALSPDGELIALVETPAAIPDGRPPLGTHRLHILY